jgi:hypothetical protein
MDANLRQSASTENQSKGCASPRAWELSYCFVGADDVIESISSAQNTRRTLTAMGTN